jgi:hypothetical protein
MRPDPIRISQFQEFLADHHYTAIVRHSKGRTSVPPAASCGRNGFLRSRPKKEEKKMKLFGRKKTLTGLARTCG